MKTLNSPLGWLLMLALVAAIIFVFIKKRAASNWGFKDVVKNPEYWDDMNAANEAADAAARAAQQWSEGEVATATRRFILEATTSQDEWEQAKILKSLSNRTHSIVLDLLRDKSLYAKLVKPTGTDLVPESPFNRACDLLGDAPGPEVVSALAPFLSDPAKGIRKDAALAIAKTGAPTIVPLIQQAFRDEDEYVRSYALMGLTFALDRSGLSDSVRADLFPDVLKLLRADEDVDDAAAVLYRLNANKAQEFFLSPEVFTAKSPILHEALEVLADAKAPVSREALLALIQSLEAEELKYPQTYTLAEALRLLGQHRNESDRDFLRQRLTHPEERVAKGAAAGLVSSFGLEGFEQRIWDVEKKNGIAGLTDQQRLYRAVFICDGEINNGGLSQYFVNSSGNDWRDALAGFKAMGFTERLNILAEATGKFGPTGPSPNRSLRQDQLSKLYKRDDTLFEALESRYYKSTEVVEVLASRYVLEHPKGFNQ